MTPELFVRVSSPEHPSGWACVGRVRRRSEGAVTGAWWEYGFDVTHANNLQRWELRNWLSRLGHATDSVGLLRMEIEDGRDTGQPGCQRIERFLGAVYEVSYVSSTPPLERLEAHSAGAAVGMTYFTVMVRRWDLPLHQVSA